MTSRDIIYECFNMYALCGSYKWQKRMTYLILMYLNERFNLFMNLNSIEINSDELTLHDVLFGSERLSLSNNLKLVSLVELYIENTGRF